MSVPLRQFVGPGNHNVMHVGTCSIAAGGSLFTQVKVQTLVEAEAPAGAVEDERANGHDDDDSSATEGEDSAVGEPSQKRSGEGKEEELVVELPSGNTYCLSASTTDAYVLEPPLHSLAKAQRGDHGDKGRKRIKVPPILLGQERGWAVSASLKLNPQSKPEQIVLRGHSNAVYHDLVPSLCVADASAGQDGKSSRRDHLAMVRAAWDETLSKRGVLEGAKISSLDRRKRNRT